MMLIKSKVFAPQSDPRLKAGDEAERQMAFLLDRRFEDRDDVFVLHDLRIQKGKYAFQIDHLVVTRYGIALIESKSIHSKVSITRHDERREHWSREFRGREEGIPSPVRQVQEQARLLREYLRENAGQVLGKLLGLLQKGFGYCPFDTYVGVSTSAVFKLARGTRLPEHVYKADEVAPEIDLQLQARAKGDSLLKLAEAPWSMSKAEALATARFLLRRLDQQISNYIAPEDRALRITPSHGEDRPLGERAIPWYYLPAVHAGWNRQLSERRLAHHNLGYRAIDYGGSPRALDPLAGSIAGRTATAGT